MGEESVAIPSRDVALYGMLHQPDTACLKEPALLFCNPIFEERKSTHRALVETARRLASEGLPVLRFDYRGCGDSPGEFRDYSVPDWVQDIEQAEAWLRRLFPKHPIGFLGVRLGASLAVQAIQENPRVSVLILWQPIASGGDYLHNDLRRALLQDMLTAGTTGRSLETMLRTLEAGGEIDFSGYPVTARLYRDLRSLSVAPLPPGWPGRILVAQASHQEQPTAETRRVMKTLQTITQRADLICVSLPPFWNLVGYVDISPLIEKTAMWLLRRGASC